MDLIEIFKPVFNDLQLVKQNLRRQLDMLYTSGRLRDNQKAHVVNIMDHFFSSSGKGLRPALVLFAAKLAGPADNSESPSRPLIQFATMVELFHSASLAHDDVLDRAKYRRERLSLNEKFGNRIAVVVGDVFISEAFSILLSLEVSDLNKKDKVFQIIFHMLREMCLGELCAHRLLSERETADIDEYVGVLEKKTATFISACCECGAILSGQKPKAWQRMADFGRNLGIAFQIADDLKDKDALAENGVDLLPLAKSYIQKAKNDLSHFHDVPAKASLMGLCDILLPAGNSPGIFDQRVDK